MKKEIKILAMSKNKNEEFVYKISIGQEEVWVKRDFFVPEYLLDLCEFYESNLLF